MSRVQRLSTDGKVVDRGGNRWPSSVPSWGVNPAGRGTLRNPTTASTPAEGTEPSRAAKTRGEEDRILAATRPLMSRTETIRPGIPRVRRIPGGTGMLDRQAQLGSQAVPAITSLRQPANPRPRRVTSILAYPVRYGGGFLAISSHDARGTRPGRDQGSWRWGLLRQRVSQFSGPPISPAQSPTPGTRAGSSPCSRGEPLHGLARRQPRAALRPLWPGLPQ